MITVLDRNVRFDPKDPKCRIPVGLSTLDAATLDATPNDGASA